jgi:hypothetical protein
MSGVALNSVDTDGVTVTCGGAGEATTVGGIAGVAVTAGVAAGVVVAGVVTAVGVTIGYLTVAGVVAGNFLFGAVCCPQTGATANEIEKITEDTSLRMDKSPTEK